MAEPFLGEMRIVSFNFPPKGWAFCNGQLLPINQNQALFSLLGTMFGGNGQTNFALPDFRGRTPIHVGSGHTLGERGGEQAHTLSTGELPTHTHALSATTGGSELYPQYTLLGNAGADIYAPPSLMAPADGTVVAEESVELEWQQTVAKLYASVPSNARRAAASLVPMAATGLTNTGGGQPHLNMQPFLVLSFVIALQGIFPSPN